MRLQHRRARGRTILVVEVGAGAARPPLPSLAAPGLARAGGRRARRTGASGAGWASTMGGSERRGMGAQQQRGGVGTRRLDGKAATGVRRRPPHWRRPAAGGRWGRCVRGGWQSHVCGSRKRKCRCVFLKKTTSY
jgi:hypothetical protein